MLYAVVKATTEAMCTRSMFNGFGVNHDVEVMVEAFAVLAIISRRWFGKVRRLDTSHLWIQEVSSKKSSSVPERARQRKPSKFVDKGIVSTNLK